MAQKKRQTHARQDASRRDKNRRQVSGQAEETEYRRPKGKRRRKRLRRRIKVLVGILCVIAVLVFLGYLIVGLFQLKQIEVSGNRYCAEQEVVDWVKSGKYSDNSLYVLWKYNQNSTKQLPSVESVRVKLKSPWKIQVQVKEKSYIGRIDYNGQYLYFDREGIASLQMTDIIEGVPCIEGMDVDLNTVKIGEVLPETDSKLFGEIQQILDLLTEYELAADKISCSGNDLTIHFGGIKVMVGSSGFEEKMAQLPPVLSKMSELYADQTGTLHLENYNASDASIRFVPDSETQ